MVLNKAQELYFYLYLYLYLYSLLIYYFSYHCIVFSLVNMHFVKTLTENGILRGVGGCVCVLDVYILYIWNLFSLAPFSKYKIFPS